MPYVRPVAKASAGYTSFVATPDVSARTRQGVFSLLGRQLITFPIGFLSGIALARLLGPTDFGTYASVSFAVMGVGALIDVGLGAIVIQQPEEPTPEQLKSIFTAQLLVFGTAALVMMLAARWVAGWFHLPVEGSWLFRAMALNMLLGTLGTNSTLLLERHLKFDVFARMDVLTVLLDRTVTLTLAFLGFGAWCFVIGSLVSMSARVVMLFKAAPWPIGLAFDRAILKRAFGFGAFLQATNLTSLARDNMNTLLGGSLLGPKAVGHLNWGMSLSTTASQPLVQIVARVCFPAFSRLQDEPEERTRMLVGSLRLVNLATFPVLMLLPAVGSPLVAYVFGEAWRPGLLALGCFAFRYMAANVTSTLVGYLNATGRARDGLRIALAWTGFEWAVGVPLAFWLGFNGIAIAYAVGILLPVVWLLAKVGREVPLPLGRIFLVPAVIGASAAALAWSLTPWITSVPALLAVVALSGGLAYGAVAYLERDWLRKFWRSRRAAPAVATEAP